MSGYRNHVIIINQQGSNVYLISSWHKVYIVLYKYMSKTQRSLLACGACTKFTFWELFYYISSTGRICISSVCLSVTFKFFTLSESSLKCLLNFCMHKPEALYKSGSWTPWGTHNGPNRLLVTVSYFVQKKQRSKSWWMKIERLTSAVDKTNLISISQDGEFVRFRLLNVFCQWEFYNMTNIYVDHGRSFWPKHVKSMVIVNICMKKTFVWIQNVHISILFQHPYLLCITRAGTCVCWEHKLIPLLT